MSQPTTTRTVPTPPHPQAGTRPNAGGSHDPATPGRPGPALSPDGEGEEAAARQAAPPSPPRIGGPGGLPPGEPPPGSPITSVPMSGPDIGEREIALVNQVLRTPILSIGPMIERFERAIADYVGVRHAIAVSSGTAGLHLAVIAAGVGEGDEVITTPFSFVASANAILYERARPVFVDIDPQTLTIDPNRIEAAITPRTRAILPVDAFGQPCDLPAILEIARRHDLRVIDDACEAIGARWDGVPVGSRGDAAVFAFYPNKQMTTAEGGVIVTNRDDWDALCRSLRNQGRGPDNTWLNHLRLGYNYRLDELSAALGLGQVERLDELLDKRARVAALYAERLADVAGVEPPYVSPRATMSWFVYVVRFARGLNRDRIMQRLAADGVPSRPYFTPVHLQPFYVERFGFKRGDFPITEDAGDRCLALPFRGTQSEAECDYVVERLKAAIAAEAAARA